jgi:hypothetical protein
MNGEKLAASFERDNRGLFEITIPAFTWTD